jgi:DNA-3-methyladenine glycosylase
VLLRAGEVIEGVDLARRRRPNAGRDSQLASGPARLTRALALTGEDDGVDLAAGRIRLTLAPEPPAAFLTGPRTGVSGPGGDAIEHPWRFWIPGEPSVSPYRAHVPKRRSP